MSAESEQKAAPPASTTKPLIVREPAASRPLTNYTLSTVCPVVRRADLSPRLQSPLPALRLHVGLQRTVALTTRHR